MAAPRIGFACLWDARRPERTWSYTPWQLRGAMRRLGDVVDVGVRMSAGGELALKLAHARWRHGRLTSTWHQSRLTDAYCRRMVRRSAAAAGCDAVLEIQDVAALDRPYFLYQDLSFDVLLHLLDQDDSLPPGLAVAALPRDLLRRRRDRQRKVYARAAGVIAMSQWFARSLVEVSGVPPERVHVVNPGRSAVSDHSDLAPPARSRPRRRLLLVGKGFLGKGGDLAVAALGILRREVDPAITLTVAGPPEWPLPEPVPDGVEFLGVRPRAEVARLYDTHDLLVMPSRLEGFGIVFAEALARGLPCIGRNRFAMPELITPGVGGALIDSDDPAALAAVICRVLDDDGLYERCRSEAAAVAGHFTWDRAASEMVELITRQVS